MDFGPRQSVEDRFAAGVAPKPDWSARTGGRPPGPGLLDLAQRCVEQSATATFDRQGSRASGSTMHSTTTAPPSTDRCCRGKLTP